jgi:hypothetical protein
MAGRLEASEKRMGLQVKLCLCSKHILLFSLLVLNLYSTAFSTLTLNNYNRHKRKHDKLLCRPERQQRHYNNED